MIWELYFSQWQMSRHALLSLVGHVVVQGEKAAEKAIIEANPITKVNKIFKDVKQAGIEADKAADLLEQQGNKVMSRREMLRRVRQYGVDYVRARPDKTVKPLAKNAWKKFGYLSDPVGLAKDLAKPENVSLLAKLAERFGGATGLYSSRRKTAEFSQPIKRRKPHYKNQIPIGGRTWG